MRTTTVSVCRSISEISRYCRHPRRNFSTKVKLTEANQTDIKKIRNVGIIAHIDAGKTTTTERFLFYSGFSRAMGEVHHGDTITDYLVQERERGITINSAAITLKWKGYKINLIDTPGHVDFTVEVERCLRVLDGAVTVIDASAGVEAQTITVWNQADKYNVPRIAFFNKMDKTKSNFSHSLQSMKTKLKTNPLPIQLPIGSGKEFQGVIDLVKLEKIVWKNGGGNQGLIFHNVKLSESTDGKLWEEANQQREQLLHNLSDLDDDLATAIILEQSLNDVKVKDINSAIRRVTLNQTAIPVLCGSAFKNIGVQLLIDAILQYLPSPADVNHNFVTAYDGALCGLAFKTVYHKQKGVLTYIRIYSGKIEQKQNIYNVSKNQNEKIGQLYEVYAEDYHEISSSYAGNIIVASSLNSVFTGDTISVNHRSAESARKNYANIVEKNVDDIPAALTIIDIPEPVFFCTIEPASSRYQKPLEHALKCMHREDPSFRFNMDDESGQIKISGMGELHIDIIKDRILRDYKVDCDLGPLQVSYRETVAIEQKTTHELNRTLGETNHYANITLSVSPNPMGGNYKEVNFFHTKDNYLNLIKREQIKAIENGIKMTLFSGPLRCYPVTDILVGLHEFETTRSTSMPMISACASQCIAELLKISKPYLLEPIMRLEIITDENHLGPVLRDLYARKSQILEIDTNEDKRIVMALVPLSELIGYSTKLRIITSGIANFSIQFENYGKVSDIDSSNMSI